MHYLIFIPNKSGPSKANLREAGLGELLRPNDHPALWSDLTGPGPGGVPGQVWTWGEGIPAYLPDQQTWTEDRKKRYWFGVSKKSPPTPQELMRNELVDGLPHQLADGREWIIPNFLKLPAVFDLDADGEPIRVPHPQYQSFADECGWALDAVSATVSSGQTPDWKRALKFAAMALTVNYRVNLAIAIGLGLLSEDLLPDLMMKAVDLPRVNKIIADLEKKEAALNQTG